jgi:regulator of RNase E activity RraB
MMAKVKFDQVLQLNFDDFIVGQTYVKEKIEDIKRENVKIGETRDSARKAIYGTVTGKLTTFEKTITSTGLLDFQIIDLVTNKVINHEKMPGTDVWVDTWGTYRGDERALTDNDKALLNRKESRPPAPQDLFLAFTNPIYNQLTQKVNSFYNRYN